MVIPSLNGSWPTGSMAAIAFTQPGVVGMLSVSIPAEEERSVLIRIDAIGICGTDIELMKGTSPNVANGLTTYPIRFGHEWGGTVVAIGARVATLAIGDRVVGEPFISCGHCQVCRGGHYNLCPHRDEVGVMGDVPGGAAQYLRMPAANVHVVPDGVPTSDALLAEPGVTVLNAFRAGRVQPGEALAIIGTGTMGLLAVQIAASMNCEVDVVGSNTSGLNLAMALGARAAYRPDEAPTSSYSQVIEASGGRYVGPLLTSLAGIGGRIMLIGIPDGAVDRIDLSNMVMKGLSIQGVLGGVDLMPRALSLIAKGVINPRLLIDEVLPASEVNRAFERLLSSARSRPKVMLDMAGFSSSTVLGSATKSDG